MDKASYLFYPSGVQPPFCRRTANNRIACGTVGLAAHFDRTRSCFFQYRNLLTAAQRQLLRAIAKEDKVYRLTAKDFIIKHKPCTPSNVQRSLDALLTKEMVYKEEQKEGSYYAVYDCFLSRWLQRA